AVLYAWYPGQIGQVALAEILAGKVNPSGKLPITIEKKFEDSPAFGYVPANRTVQWPGSKNTPGEREGKRELVYDVNYKEDIFVGYRWYEHKGIKPLYRFGEGLSYSTFAYANLQVSAKDFARAGKVQVTFDVKNTSGRSGDEIAQLYVGQRKCSVERPEKELKGFRKVSLKPGETQTVTLVLDKRDFQFWSPTTKAWTLEPGTFDLAVGGSSAAPLKKKIELPALLQ
ncbi:MAG: fibronectin type III-like domain-contianing protein, partial [Hymenobacter sp.]|nr:fibronectin type III-like domain-contianing protein [Hymenobacter sp.]